MPNIKKDEYDDIPIGDEDTMVDVSSQKTNISEVDPRIALQANQPLPLTSQDTLVPDASQSNTANTLGSTLMSDSDVVSPKMMSKDSQASTPVMSNLGSQMPVGVMPINIPSSDDDFEKEKEQVNVVDIDSFVKRIIKKDLDISLNKK